jgi:hypothetical protein
MVNNNNQHNTDISEHQTPKTWQQQRPMKMYIVILMLWCNYLKCFPVYLFKAQIWQSKHLSNALPIFDAPIKCVDHVFRL